MSINDDCPCGGFATGDNKYYRTPPMPDADAHSTIDLFDEKDGSALPEADYIPVDPASSNVTLASGTAPAFAGTTLARTGILA
jgi:hypothetical protein